MKVILILFTFSVPVTVSWATGRSSGLQKNHTPTTSVDAAKPGTTPEKFFFNRFINSTLVTQWRNG